WGGPAKAHSATGVINFSDADDTNTHEVSAAAKGEAYLGKFIPSISNAATGDNAGQITWKFTVDDKDIDFLGAGDKLVQTYTITLKDSSGATVTQDVTITLVGTNDRAEITANWWAGDDWGVVVEDGKWNSEKTASGDLDIKDVDQGEAVFQTPESLEGTYGTFTFNAATGQWSYVINNKLAATQALNGWKVAEDTLTVYSKDGTDSHTITVYVNGTNDIAVISGESAGTITEDVKMTTGGKLSVTDVDTGEAVFDAPSGNSLKGNYGAFAFNAKTGEWTYQAATDKVQKLAAGETVTETLTVWSADGTDSQKITMTITGTNDKPVFVSGGDTSTTLTEGKVESGNDDHDHGHGHGHGYGYGNPPAASTELKASGEIGFTDVDASDKHTVTVSKNETYLGTFSANVSNDSTNDGKGTVSWSFKVDDSKVNYLAAGQKLVQTYTITLDDKNGGTVTHTVTVNIVGTNDAPVLVADMTDAVGAAKEDASKPELTDTGVITFKDVDLIDTHTLNVSGSKSNSLGGKLTVGVVTESDTTENGSFTWTYKVDNAKVQYLGEGDTAKETFTVTISDGKGGTITQDITVTVTGTNDAATISADWWNDLGYVREDGTYNSEKVASGDLDIKDVDQGEAVFKQPTSAELNGTYGTFQFNKQTGEWFYTIDNARTETQALNGGKEVYDTLTVWSADGTDSHTVYVLVSGTNDNAVISGKADGIVVEDGVQTAGGTLSVKDVDAGEAKFQSVSDWALDGTYGKFTFNATTGEWTYKVDNGKVQALGAGDTVSDSLTVRSFDGTDSQVIKVTINGTNDPAQITGTKTGAVVEDGVSYASGDLDIKDVDHREAEFVKIEGNALNGTYGKFTFNQNSGKWEYRLDNTLAATQALKAGQVVTETLTVKAVDGTTALVEVKVTGTNDGASIGGSRSGSVTEDGGQTAEGTLTVSDRDTGENQPAAPASLAGKYGSFTLDTATGAWKYTLDNTNAAVQGLVTGKSLIDTLTVKSVDGTATETISVTINGTDDTAVINGTVTGAVNENDALNTASGTLSVTDADAGQAGFKVPTTSELKGTYGAFTFDASNGKWVYTLDNTLAATQALVAGQKVTETLTVKSLDGSDSETITVTVTGANDVANITGNAVGAVIENASDNTATGTLSVSDVDAGQASFTVPTTSELKGTYGAFTFDASNGKWVYTLDNALDATQALVAGQKVTETLTVKSLDGSDSETITVTVTGANDVAAITGTASGDVTEDAATNTATGTLSVSDVDAGQAGFATPTASELKGTYGTFTFDASNGKWVYTLDNTLAATQALTAGQKVTESLTIKSLDGSDSEVIKVNVTGAAEASPVAINESTSATGRYAFVDSNDSPNSINFDASKLFTGVTSATKYSYSVVSATDTPWLSTDGKMVEGNPRSDYGSWWNYDSNGDTGLYVYQVTATTNGVAQTTYVAFSAIESAGTTFNIQNNGNWNNSGSLDYANDRNGDGDVINIVSSGIKDQVQAGAGDDVVVGYSDDNNIDGGSGDDAIYGMGGDDFLDGWTGNDFLDGGAGNDTLYGYDGNDVLLGGAGNDFLSGESGNDILVGGSGNDDLSGGTGVDYLTGGAGSDTFILSDLNAVDVITDFNASEDTIDLTALLDGISKTTDLETSGYVKAVQSGSDTLLQVDTNGGGNNWNTVAVLQNYTHTNEAIRILFDDSTHKPVEQQV
ncbi:type 1 secretion target domain-containng protein, partial [Rhizobium sp. PDO1-076]